MIKLLLTSIQRQRKQMARSPSDQEYQVKEGEVISQLLKFLKPKLRRALSARMACYHESKVLQTELQVYIKLNWYKVVYNLRQNRPWETCVHKLLFVRNRCKRARTERVKHERSCVMSNLFTYHSVRVTENASQPNAGFQNPDLRYLLVGRIWRNTKRCLHISILFLKISHKTPYAGLTFTLIK